ncbi:MAG: hypothetical protein ACM3S0_01440 [Acidobacteriota bacterium]
MQFDPRLSTLGISRVETPGAAWVLQSAEYQDETQSGGNHIILFTVLDVSGKPVPNVICVVDWVGRDPSQDPPTRVVTNVSGQANVPIYANLDIHLLNGPYFAFIEDQSKSDVVRGMGLPEHHHVNFLLTFGPRSGGGSDPSQTLDQAVVVAAQKYTWMPINTDAALYRYAQTKNLGYPQTDEFELTFGGDSYVAQVYNLGIVYVKKGDWGDLHWTKKPGQ